MRRICSYIVTSLALVLVLGVAAGTASAAPGAQSLFDPGVEIGSGTTPTYWSPAPPWGTGLTSIMTWSTDAHSGTHSLRAEITARGTEGDEKWQPTPVSVTGGTYYTFSDWYKSNVSTAVSVEYWIAGQDTSGDGTWVNLFSGIAPAGDWTQYQTGFTMPANAVKAIFVHLIASKGYLETDDYAMIEQASPPGFTSPVVSLTFDDGSQGFYDNALPLVNARGYKTTQYIPTADLVAGDYSFMMTPQEISTVASQGHEIGSHSITHPDLTTISDAQLANELQASKTYLEAMPYVGQVTDFAYPFGTYDARVIAAEQAAGYATGRSVEPGYNSKLDVQPYDIRVQNMTRTTTMAEFQSWVDYAKSHNYWLVIVYHEVQLDTAPLCQNENGDPTKPDDLPGCLGTYDTTVSLFTQQLDYFTTAGVGPDVMTIKQALATLGPQVPPSVGKVTIAPTAPTTSQTLTATPAGFTWLGGTGFTYHYQWLVNDAPVAGATAATFDLSQAGHGDHGDKVSVSVYASAGSLTSTSTSDVVTVANTAPTKGTVTIAPSAAKPGQSLTATPAGFADADNDALTYHYTWSVNGTVVAGATGATLTNPTTVRDDKVSVSVTADDAHSGTTDAATANLTVGNTPPVKGSVTISPASPKAGEMLTATPTGFTDVDGDTLSYHYTWSVNGKVIKDATAATYAPTAAVHDDIVSVKVSADDGKGGTSDDAGASVTLANTAPTKGTVTISPASRTAGTALTGEPSGFTDVDGDALSYQYTWYYNGQQIAGATGATLPSSAVRAGEIRVDVRASDGHGGMSEASTLTVIVGRALDTSAPAISITAPKATTYKFGEQLLVSFTCSDPSGVASCTATLGLVGGKAIPVLSGKKVLLSKIGRYVLRITANDRIGNAASTSLQFSVVDKVAPKILITSPKGKTYGVGQKLLVKFSCTDAAGITSYKATLGRVGAKTAKVESGKKVKLMTTGRYVLKVTAKDRNGNTASKTLYFTVKH